MPEQITPPPQPPPSSTPTPAPHPAPQAPKPAASPDPSFDAMLDAEFGASDLTPSAPEPPKSKADAPPAAAAPASPKPAAKPEPPKSPESGPKQLREEYAKTKAELEAKSAAIAAMEAKIKAFESRGMDVDALTKKLEDYENEKSAMQGELRALKQEASPEWKQKFEEPFNKAASQASQFISELTTTEGNPADWQKDFAPLYSMRYSDAFAKAKEVFGEDSAQAVMQEWRTLKKLDREKGEALEAEKKQWKQREESERANRAQQQQRIISLRDRVTQELRDKVEDYRDTAEDAEAGELRKKAYEIIDKDPKTLDQQIIRDAHIRHRVAAFPVLKLKLTRAQSRIAELEEKLNGKRPRTEGSRPGGDLTKAPEKSWEQGLVEAVDA